MFNAPPHFCTPKTAPRTRQFGKTMQQDGLEWNHGVEWSGMDFSGGCILVILGHFDTFGHFGFKFGSFCSKT